MQITVFNGSPRYKKSNSKILIEHFLEGMGEQYKVSTAIHYLAKTDNTKEHQKAFEDAENVLIVMPLYTDSMPGIVKHFIEQIALKRYTSNKNVGFIIQCGFPETIHLEALERYLKKLTTRLNCTYLGCIQKSGVEGIQIMPPFMTVKLYAQMQNLGKTFKETGKFDEIIIQQLKKPYKISFARRIMFYFGQVTGLNNFYWNMNLKKNGAFERRFAKPYGN